MFPHFRSPRLEATPQNNLQPIERSWAPWKRRPASLCRLFRTIVLDPFTAGFELRQIVLGDSFPHYVHSASGLGFVGAAWKKFCLECVDFPARVPLRSCGLFEPHTSAATFSAMNSTAFRGRRAALDGALL